MLLRHSEDSMRENSKMSRRSNNRHAHARFSSISGEVQTKALVFSAANDNIAAILPYGPSVKVSDLPLNEYNILNVLEPARGQIEVRRQKLALQL